MYECKYGASNGDRTRMVFKPRDFLTTIAFATCYKITVCSLEQIFTYPRIGGGCMFSTHL